MLERDSAPGIRRIDHAYVNFYLVEADDGVTVVDAGHPRSWGPLVDALGRIGRSLRDVAALVLTHGHFDHVGFARRLREEVACRCGRRRASGEGPQIVARAATADSARALGPM